MNNEEMNNEEMNNEEMNNEEMNDRKNESFDVEGTAAEVAEPVSEAASEISPTSQAEIVAVKPKKGRGKLIVAIVAIVLALAMLSVGAATVYNVYLENSSPVAVLARTLKEKYKIKTTFDMKKYSEEGTAEVELKLKGGNTFSLPAGTIGFSASRKGNTALLKGNFYDERFEAYLTKGDIVASLPDMEDGEYYGASVKKFRENLEASIFGPDSGTEYALDEETFEAICQYVEMTNGEYSKELEKELRLVARPVNTAFRKSELSNVKKGEEEIEILGESRLVRIETYTINEDSLRSFLDELVIQTERANDRTVDAYESLRKKLGTVGDEMPIWEDLTKSIKEAAQTCEMGDLEIRIDLCYTGKYVSAILVDAISQDEFLDFDLTVDFGENPTESVDTVVAVNTLWEQDSLEATATLTEEIEDGVTTYVLSGKAKTTPFEFLWEEDDDSVLDRNEIVKPAAKTYEGKIVLELNRDDGDAILDVEYFDSARWVELLSIECGYVDQEDSWGLQLRKVTLVGTEIKLRTMRVELSVVLTHGADEIVTKSYENVLEWQERDARDFSDDLNAYREYIAETYGIPALKP